MGTPLWQDSHGALWQGDVRACLAAMPAESVHMTVCSPPYWGLRSYNTEPQIWGGSPECDHTLIDTPGTRIRSPDETQSAKQLSNHGAVFANAWQPDPPKPPMTGGSGAASAKQVSNAGSQFGNAWREQASPRLGRHASAVAEGLEGGNAYGNHEIPASRHITSATCTRCGAWRGELGSEKLHDCAGWATGAPCGACFICHLLEVFRGVWRVLRPDGVVFVNLGDSYSGSGKGWGGGSFSEKSNHFDKCGAINSGKVPPGLKAKDLCGIPWRFALAMQAAGWWLRGDYIWSKPNPMPESVTDRCTRSHEYVFHFSKASTYYWNPSAIRETRGVGPTGIVQPANLLDQGVIFGSDLGLGTPPAARARPPASIDDARLRIEYAVSYATAILEGTEFEGEFSLAALDAQVRQEVTEHAHRVLVSCGPVVHGPTVSSTGLPIAKRAAVEFLQQLQRLSITLPDSNVLGVGLGMPEGANLPRCGGNGDAAIRVDDTSEVGEDELMFHNQDYSAGGTTLSESGRNCRSVWAIPTEPFKGAHFAVFPRALVRRCILAASRPGDTVLDPFAGSGTTLLVARQLGRIGWGIELNPEYVEMSLKRLRQGVLL